MLPIKVLTSRDWEVSGCVYLNSGIEGARRLTFAAGLFVEEQLPMYLTQGMRWWGAGGGSRCS